MKTGKAFEIFVTNVQCGLRDEPGVKVLHNQFINDRNGCRRQIDVLIEAIIGGQMHRTVIECKSGKSKVTLDMLESFQTKLAVLGAHQGIIVSENGFQSGVLRSIKATNIKLCEISHLPTLEEYFMRYKFNLLGLRHESVDIVVSFAKPHILNELVTTKSPLFALGMSAPTTIAEIAREFLKSRFEIITDQFFKSIPNILEVESTIGYSDIHCECPSLLVFELNGDQTFVIGFSATIKSTLSIKESKLKKVLSYSDVVGNRQEAVVLEMAEDRLIDEWMKKYGGE